MWTGCGPGGAGPGLDRLGSPVDQAGAGPGPAGGRWGPGSGRSAAAPDPGASAGRPRARSPRAAHLRPAAHEHVARCGSGSAGERAAVTVASRRRVVRAGSLPAGGSRPCGRPTPSECDRARGGAEEGEGDARPDPSPRPSLTTYLRPSRTAPGPVVLARCLSPMLSCSSRPRRAVRRSCVRAGESWQSRTAKRPRTLVEANSGRRRVNGSGNHGDVRARRPPPAPAPARSPSPTAAVRPAPRPRGGSPAADGSTYGKRGAAEPERA